MSTISNHLSIEDLPTDCIEEILKHILKVTDRNNARLVCKLWRDLLNYDCSMECYRITTSTMMRASRSHSYYQKSSGFPHEKILTHNIDFQYLIPLFLTFQRKKISIHFEFVNLENSEQFWIQKGADMAHIHFELECPNIPLIEIIKYCSRLRSLTFGFFYSSYARRYIEILQKKRLTHENNITNLSVNNLKFLSVQLIDVTNIVHTFIASFPQTKNIFIECVKCYEQFDVPTYLNSLCDNFKDIKSVITLSTSYRTGEKSTFEINSQLGNDALKVMSLLIKGQLHNDHFPLHRFSQFPCQRKYLDWLYFDLSWPNEQSLKLDKVEEIVSRSPLLTFLGIDTNLFCNIIPLTNRLSRNNIKILEFRFRRNGTSIINDAFLHSFVHLKSMRFYELVYNDFVKLINHLECLEELIIYEGVEDINAVLDCDLKRITTVLNRKLIKLKIPQLYLVLLSATNYEFYNLKQLTLSRNRVRKIERLYLKKGIAHHLKRIYCPKIELLSIEAYDHLNELSQEINEQKIMKILSLYPTLHTFSAPCGNRIGNQMMEKIRETYPGLQNITLF